MKKNSLALILFFSFVISHAQTKKVLLEEFTGANCGNCPLGSYYADSMLALYPNLISVSLHAYQVTDAMDFPEIDTLDNTYSQGAPLAAIDRICGGSSSTQTAVFVNTWNGNIQQRLSVPAALTVSIVPSWNSSTRNISAQVGIDILSNIPAGDYRLSLYIVEDSVTGTGAGYDQESFYDTDPNSPFFGMGNPIVGFVHKHVARALLPSSWGLQGLIPSAPITGQNFNHTFNYALPALYDENRVHLVAFVYRFTSNHTGDEVLNVSEEKLLQSPAGVLGNIPGTEIEVYPNPFSQRVVLKFVQGIEDASFILYDLYGKKIKSLENISGGSIILHRGNLESGIYFYQVIDGKKKAYSGKLIAY